MALNEFESGVNTNFSTELNENFTEINDKVGTIILGEGAGEVDSGASAEWIDIGNFTHTGDLGTKEIIVDIWVIEPTNTATSIGCGIGNASGTTLDGQSTTAVSWKVSHTLNITKEYNLTTSVVWKIPSTGSLIFEPDPDFVVNATEIFYVKGKSNFNNNNFKYYWKARLVQDSP